ncbi:phage holin family protein [Paracoccus sp. (in: a-proteobacteria)]|uniref:phage holin family protein n=1 Tax=Paracoccus sp. TaxID=267 RepID=UPI0028A18BC7|nr:phage holin family protein [Paracoccus sp. (in: a-proteobacteria)]
MLDYAHKMRLAVSDATRRVSLKAGAGVIVLIGAGFLLAALWTWLADHLQWGSMKASLVIGAVFLILGLLVLVGTGRARHRPPTTDELRAELEERLSLATDAVLDRVTGRAERALDRAKETASDALEAAQLRVSNLTDKAGQRVQSLVDTVSYTADRVAGTAEAKAHGFVRSAEDLAEQAGLTPERRERIGEQIERAKSSNLAALAPVVGAFAVGITLASRLQSWRHQDDDLGSYYDEDPEDWDDDQDWGDDELNGFEN